MVTQQASDALLRRRVRLRGVVQGVGFRPYVHGLATELRLSGSVLNDGAGVLADVQGSPAAVEAFCTRVAAEAPRCACVEGVEWEALPAAPGSDAPCSAF